jgi:UDP-GlcNAc:undecaprenyl-phosphate GlcNAc-1-phosphate transferase
MNLILPVLAISIAFAASIIFVPAVRWVSFRLGKVSAPRNDRWNTRPTPTLGGVGVFLAFALALAITTLLGQGWDHLQLSLMAGSGLMFGLGLVDDLKRLTPPAKLMVQILAASAVVFFGGTINFFPWGFANSILTFLWLIGITNAINLLDNMDGLAGGIALISAGFLAYFFYRAETIPLLTVAMALCGSILGFLIFNFPPAKIFMGDSGSLFLGFTLAALAVVHRPRASEVFTVIGVPTLLFLVPIVDTTLVTITRILRGQSPVQGGTDHTSHRLIAFGLTERQAVLFLYLIGLISGITGALLEALDYDLSLLLGPVLLIVLALLAAYLGRLKVVSSITPQPSNITRIMVDLTYKRRLFEMILDFFIIGVCYYLAFWTTYSMQLDNSRLIPVLRSLPVALVGALISFVIFGVYRGVWRYVGVDDLVHYASGSVGAAVLTAVPLMISRSFRGFPHEVYFLFGVFIFLGLAASRLSFRILDGLYTRQIRRDETMSVLIYGTQDAGEMALRWILRNPDLGYRPVGFLDDDPLTWGRRIHGVNILGGREQFEAILSSRHTDGVIITAQNLLENGNAEKLLETCRKKGIWIRMLKLDFELIE